MGDAKLFDPLEIFFFCQLFAKDAEARIGHIGATKAMLTASTRLARDTLTTVGAVL